MVTKVYAGNDASQPAPTAPVNVRRLSVSDAHRRLWLSSPRHLLAIWFSAVFTPWILQVRSYLQMAAPHKINQDLLALNADHIEIEVPQSCPVKGINIAGAWWNIMPTHYSVSKLGTLCHFVVPQYNMHGAYHIGSDDLAALASPAAASEAEDCSTKTSPIDYYFYHGSFGYYSFYEEGEGTVCADDWTATIIVKKVGAYDINGRALANDRGSTDYRISYYFIIINAVWIVFRALVIRRSFILFKRHLAQCYKQRVFVGLRDVLVYIQESARLTAYSANNLQRVILLYGLLDASMSDLFVFITKGGLSALIQCISLCYNIASIISILLEILETSTVLHFLLGERWPRMFRILKRLVLNHETNMLGEFAAVFFLQMYITTLNRSQLQDTLPVALAISYYAWSLVGHGFVAIGMVLFLFLFRSVFGVASVWWKYGSLRPLVADSRIENILQARQKLILVTGYDWDQKRLLYYSKETLTSYGLMLATIDEKESQDTYLVSYRINWLVANNKDLEAVAAVRGNHIFPCYRALSSSFASVQLCDRALGGSPADIIALQTDEVLGAETSTIVAKDVFAKQLSNRGMDYLPTAKS